MVISWNLLHAIVITGYLPGTNVQPNIAFPALAIVLHVLS